MGKTRILTNSMAGCFLSCRQKFDYRFNRQIVPVEDNVTALSFGSAVHAALERWFRYGIKDDAILVAESFPGLELENQLKASVLVEKYIEHWGDKEPFEVVDVEKEFNVPLRNPANGHKSRTWTLCGKADGIVELDGDLYILEHKTTSCLDDAYIQRIGIDRQIAVYANAFKSVYVRGISSSSCSAYCQVKDRYVVGKATGARIGRGVQTTASGDNRRLML